MRRLNYSVIGSLAGTGLMNPGGCTAPCYAPKNVAHRTVRVYFHSAIWTGRPINWMEAPEIWGFSSVADEMGNGVA